LQKSQARAPVGKEASKFVRYRAPGKYTAGFQKHRSLSFSERTKRFQKGRKVRSDLLEKKGKGDRDLYRTAANTSYPGKDAVPPGRANRGEREDWSRQREKNPGPTP